MGDEEQWDMTMVTDSKWTQTVEPRFEITKKDITQQALVGITLYSLIRIGSMCGHQFPKASRSHFVVDTVLVVYTHPSSVLQMKGPCSHCQKQK